MVRASRRRHFPAALPEAVTQSRGGSSPAAFWRWVPSHTASGRSSSRPFPFSIRPGTSSRGSRSRRSTRHAFRGGRAFRPKPRWNGAAPRCRNLSRSRRRPMDSPITATLKELPDADSLEREKEAIQAKLAEGGSRIALLNWKLAQDTALAGLTDCLAAINPIEWIAKGWGTALEVQELARQTAGKPDAEKPLPLAKHTIPVTLHPIVTIHCD